MTETRTPSPPPDVGGLTQKSLGTTGFVDYAIIVGIAIVGIMAVVIAAMR